MTAHDCPDCRCWTPEDARPPQPSASNSWAREAAKRAAAEAVKAAKAKRSAPYGEAS